MTAAHCGRGCLRPGACVSRGGRDSAARTPGLAATRSHPLVFRRKITRAAGRACAERPRRRGRPRMRPWALHGPRLRLTPFSLQSLEAGERQEEGLGWTGFRGRPAGVCWPLKGSLYGTRCTDKTRKSTGQGVPWGTHVPDFVELSRTNCSHACRLPSGAPEMQSGLPCPTPGASCDSWTGRRGQPATPGTPRPRVSAPAGHPRPLSHKRFISRRD